MSDPPAPHDERDGPQHDLDVLPDRPVDDVEVVEREHLAQRDPRGAEHLPEPRHAGVQVQPAPVPAADQATSIARLTRRCWTVRPKRRTPRKSEPWTSSKTTAEPTTSKRRGLIVTFTPSAFMSRTRLRRRSPSRSDTATIRRCTHCSW